MKLKLICAALIAAVSVMAVEVPKWRIDELTSPAGKPENYAPAKMADLKAEYSRTKIADAVEYRLVLTNNSASPRFLRPAAAVAVKAAEPRFWNGYLAPGNPNFDPGDKALSTWFPVQAAIAGNKAQLFGIHPLALYSRVDSGHRGEKGHYTMELGFPVYLEPGKSFTASVISAEIPALFGSRDAIQKYYDLFPQAYRLTPGVHCGIVSGETDYLYWKADAKVHCPLEMIRRYYGGNWSWEWCYKPFVRAGDWAISDQYTVGFEKFRTPAQVEKARERSRRRLAQAENARVLPMWYLNVRWSNWELAQEKFPEILLKDSVKAKCWNQNAVRGIYCYTPNYSKLFKESLVKIPQLYPAVRGIGWDSCFAHEEIPFGHAGFHFTEPKSFYQRKPMVLEAVGVSQLLDFAHQPKAQGFTLANAVNFKLTSPYMIGARTDSALYEGNPMQNPNRLGRIEAMRMRLGSPKVIGWHKQGAPDNLKWVDWDEMSKAEAQDAYRQLLDNVLFLSYYWGCAPAPAMPGYGVVSIVRAMPELASLLQQGWQPSQGVTAPKDLLVARYGSGVGSRIAVINPGIAERKAELKFPAAYWNHQMVWAAPEKGGAAQSRFVKDATLVSLTLPPRAVTLVRVAALSSVPAEELTVTGSRVAEAGNLPFYRLEVRSMKAVAVNAELVRLDPQATVRLKIGDDSGRFTPEKKLCAAIDTGKFSVDVQENNQRSGIVEVREYPLFDVSPLDTASLRALKLPEAAKTGKLAIVVTDPALKAEAKRIAAWFSFYNQQELPAVVDKAPADADKLIVLKIAPDEVKKFRTASADLEGNTVSVTLGKAADAPPMLLTLLNAFDEAWPWYGTLPEKGGYKKIGLAGKTLYPAPVKCLLRPTLLEMMKRCRLLED